MIGNNVALFSSVSCNKFVNILVKSYWWAFSISFKVLGIEPNDLSFFNDLGVDGIRLDEGVGAKETSDMTYNPYGIKIELNNFTWNKCCCS